MAGLVSMYAGSDSEPEDITPAPAPRPLVVYERADDEEDDEHHGTQIEGAKDEIWTTSETSSLGAGALQVIMQLLTHSHSHTFFFSIFLSIYPSLSLNRSLAQGL